MERIYLDHAATTPVHPDVADVVYSLMTKQFGNASSLHLFGDEAKEVMEASREKIASILGCASHEIIFTSGGTESDNTAIIGYALAHASKGRHILVSSIEHEGVLSPARYLANEGFEIEYLEPDRSGVVPLAELQKKLRKDTILVSVMWANNETGIIQPIELFSQELRKRGIGFHTDAVQAVGKLEIDPTLVDLLSASAHKFYGPKGIGFLYAKEGVAFRPLIRGGGHEHNMRSGTENVPGIAGMAKALEICQLHRTAWNERFRNWKAQIMETVYELQGQVNSSLEEALPNLLNLSFPGVSGEALAAAMSFEGIAVSTSSACASHHEGKDEKWSHVLKAMGLEQERMINAIRISMGDANNAEQIDRFCQVLKQTIHRIRSMGVQG